LAFSYRYFFPTRKILAAIYQRLLTRGYPLSGVADHGVSEALYLGNTDGNGVELYWDKLQERWPKNDDGSLHMFTRALDIDGLPGSLD
jgi:catechol 2,3-dioxygenase